MWSRMVKRALGGRGLWNHVNKGEAPKHTVDGKQIFLVDEDKWFQEDHKVLSIIQNSLETYIRNKKI